MNILDEQDFHKLNFDLFKAALEGNKDEIDHLISLGIDDYRTGLWGAAHGGHEDLVKFFFQKIKVVTLSILNVGIYNAYSGGVFKKIGGFFIKNGGNVNNGLSETVEYKDKELLLYLIQQLGNQWNMALLELSFRMEKNLLSLFQKESKMIKADQIGNKV